MWRRPARAFGLNRARSGWIPYIGSAGKVNVAGASDCNEVDIPGAGEARRVFQARAVAGQLEQVNSIPGTARGSERSSSRETGGCAQARHVDLSRRVDGD